MKGLGKRIPVYTATIVTWFLTGVWHGAAWNFIVWGMLNCFFIVLSEELMPLYDKFHGRFHLKDKFWYGGFEMLRMFMLMNLMYLLHYQHQNKIIANMYVLDLLFVKKEVLDLNLYKYLVSM